MYFDCALRVTLGHSDVLSRVFFLKTSYNPQPSRRSSGANVNSRLFFSVQRPKPAYPGASVVFVYQTRWLRRTDINRSDEKRLYACAERPNEISDKRKTQRANIFLNRFPSARRLCAHCLPRITHSVEPSRTGDRDATNTWYRVARVLLAEENDRATPRDINNSWWKLQKVSIPPFPPNYIRRRSRVRISWYTTPLITHKKKKTKQTISSLTTHSIRVFNVQHWKSLSSGHSTFWEPKTG